MSTEQPGSLKAMVALSAFPGRCFETSGCVKSGDLGGRGQVRTGLGVETKLTGGNFYVNTGG